MERVLGGVPPHAGQARETTTGLVEGQLDP